MQDRKSHEAPGHFGTNSHYKLASNTFFKKSRDNLVKKNKLISYDDIAKVYEGECSTIKNPIMIKIFNSSASYASQYREISIMEKLAKSASKNIQKLEFYYIDINYNYNIVAEYPTEDRLADWLNGEEENVYRPPLRLAKKKEIMCGLLNGVAIMHDVEIIHGHITPLHIRLDKSLNPLLCDFQWAQQIGKDSPVSLENKDKRYLAPEVLRDIHINKTKTSLTTKTDIYSLAIVFWQIVTDKRSFLPDIFESNELVKTVVLEKQRPSIPNKSICSPKVAEFITSGWNDNPTCRPSAQNALKVLSKASVPTNDSYDAVDLAIAIDFLYKKFAFFTAPFTNYDSFHQWAEQHESEIASISDGLKKFLNSRDQLEEFKRAMLGKSDTDTNCLRAKNTTLIKAFLLHDKSAGFITFLREQIANPVINKWHASNSHRNKIR